MIDMIDAKKYVCQFNVINQTETLDMLVMDQDNKNNENDEKINCEKMSTILYTAILNKFIIRMGKAEYVYFREYQERVFDLVENLRELDVNDISTILTYISKIDIYLVDIIIMLWCVPRIDNLLSKKIYQIRYRQNIQQYNAKLCNLITHDTIKYFCIETLTKVNNVPAHCMDYIWYYMANMEIEFDFYNSENGAYIGFEPIETDESDKIDKNKCDRNQNKCDQKSRENIIQIGINFLYFLELGLGSIIYANDLKGSFKNFIKSLVTNVAAVKNLLADPNKKNFSSQLLAICRCPKKYFDDGIVFDGEILAMIGLGVDN